MSRNTCARPLAVLAGMLSLCLPAFSQFGFTVKGELQGAQFHSDYLVELVDTMRRGAPVTADVGATGFFEIRHVQAGEYTLSVTSLNGDVLHRQLVTVSESSGPIVVRMMEASKRSGTSTVSVKQLLHPPTKKAFRSFVEAQRFSESGDYSKAAQALEHAVQESPDYAEARVNLGAQYVRIGQFDSAIVELRRAIEIAGPTPVALCNLASAQARAGQTSNAMESARGALRLDSGFVPAHLILGAMLANDVRTRSEAIAHLERAAEEHESARRILEQIRQSTLPGRRPFEP
jgi:tetratricopeptide (TPR) repeat protein